MTYIGNCLKIHLSLDIPVKAYTVKDQCVQENLSHKLPAPALNTKSFEIKENALFSSTLSHI